MINGLEQGRLGGITHDDGTTAAPITPVEEGGTIVYVDPPKMVVIPLGASVMTGPLEVTTVKVDPSTANKTHRTIQNPRNGHDAEISHSVLSGRLLRLG